MPFIFKKILAKGASHPVVARLQMQAGELLQNTNFGKDQHDAILQASFDASFRLIRCFDIAQRLKAQCAEAEGKHEPGDNPKARHIPHVIGLEQEAETFLYEAKNFLRDVAVIVNATFGTTFNEASQFTKKKASKSKITKWAESTFGLDDRFTQFFRVHEGWIGEVVRMRNAVEHPGGWSGTLHIVNYEPMPDGSIRRPVWHIDNEAPSRLVEDMEGLCEQMLVFADELIALIVDRNLHPAFQLYEIPEDKRDPQVPKSFVVSLSPDLARKLSATAARSEATKKPPPG